MVERLLNQTTTRRVSVELGIATEVPRDCQTQFHGIAGLIDHARAQAPMCPNGVARYSTGTHLHDLSFEPSDHEAAHGK
jgi:hypothetical protein